LLFIVNVPFLFLVYITSATVLLSLGKGPPFLQFHTYETQVSVY